MSKRFFVILAPLSFAAFAYVLSAAIQIPPKEKFVALTCEHSEHIDFLGNREDTLSALTEVVTLVSDDTSLEDALGILDRASCDMRLNIKTRIIASDLWRHFVQIRKVLSSTKGGNAQVQEFLNPVTGTHGTANLLKGRATYDNCRVVAHTFDPLGFKDNEIYQSQYCFKAGNWFLDPKY